MGLRFVVQHVWNEEAHSSKAILMYGVSSAFSPSWNSVESSPSASSAFRNFVQ